MKSRVFICMVLFFSVVFSLSAQVVSGDLTTIYTLGNAAPDQKLGTGTGNGAYDNQKNGYYAQANLYVNFRPISYLEGYFKLYATARPGAFYVPLSVESYSQQNFDFGFDKLYGRVSVFDALELDLPVNLYLKTGKYKAQAANFQTISRFGLENILDLMETDNTWNYEVQAEMKPMGADSSVYASFAGNYRFDEGIQRLYDNDGGVSLHGQKVLDEFAPQFMVFLGCQGIEIAGSPVMGELIYGKNVAGIYSGNSFGFDANYGLTIVPDVFVFPIGLGFGYFEKNIDPLGHNSGTDAGNSTVDFRNVLDGAFSVGLRYKTQNYNYGATNYAVDVSLAGVFTRIEHIYREPLSIFSLSLDAQFTYNDHYFVGAGLLAGTLADARWQTKSDPKYVPLDNGGYDHTFSLADNLGYEFYAGLLFRKGSRFVIGFNQNKGISMNYNLENKVEGLYKYKLAGSDAADGLYETGGIYVKFVMSW